MLKIIIPSKNRSQTICTHRYLEDLDYTIVVHNETDRKEYLRNKELDPKKVVVSGVPYGISKQRQWIQDNLVKPGEWYLMLKDNMSSVVGYPRDFWDRDTIDYDAMDQEESRRVQKLGKTAVNLEMFTAAIHFVIAEAERIGAYNCGFATVDNPFFWRRRFRKVGYVLGDIWLIKKTEVNFDQNVLAMDDYAFTAEHLYKFGKVLIFNYIFSVSPHYQPGGIGTYQDRLKRKREDCRYLMAKYPGLFAYYGKAGCDKLAELKVRFNNSQQVERWRQALARQRFLDKKLYGNKLG